MPISPWLAARAVLPVAALLVVAAGAAIVSRAAVPCSGSLRRIAPGPGDAGALPVVASAERIGEPKRERGFDTGAEVTGTYALGDLRLQYSYDDDRGRPSSTSFHLEDPRSCDGGSIDFETGMYGERGSIALRRAPAGGPYMITWRDMSGMSEVLRSIAFAVDPPGPLRSLRRHQAALIVLLLGAAAGVLAIRRAARAAAYFRRGGIATWRAGRVDAPGRIAPEDGSASVPAAFDGLEPGTPVLFSTDPAPRAWTFRDVGDAPAAAVVVGSPAEVAARYTTDARGALMAAAVAVAAGGSVLIALSW